MYTGHPECRYFNYSFTVKYGMTYKHCIQFNKDSLFWNSKKKNYFVLPS